MNKRYKLLHDIFDANAGTEFYPVKINDTQTMYEYKTYNGKYSRTHEHFVVGNDLWFKEIPDKEDTPVQEDKFVWNEELVLLAIDMAHHNGWHKTKQRCVEVFDEVKKQASGNGYKYPQWIIDHLASKQSVPNEQPSSFGRFNCAGNVIDASCMNNKINEQGKDWEIVSYKAETRFGFDAYFGGAFGNFAFADFFGCSVTSDFEVDSCGSFASDDTSGHRRQQRGWRRRPRVSRV